MKLSIIIPVYNVEKYIGQCLESVLSINYDDYEVIIVNDGSTDNSIQICQQMIGEDRHFRILSKPNGGLMSAWKFGVENSNSEYIGFVDSDDWIDSEMFSVLMKKVEETKADIVESGYIFEKTGDSIHVTRDKDYIYERNKITDYIHDYCISYLRLINNPTICRWDKIYRRELLIKQFDLMNEEITVGEDFNTNIAVLMETQKIVMIGNFVPYHYRANLNSIYNSFNLNRIDNVDNLARTVERIIEKYHKNDDDIRSFIGHMYFEELNRICASGNLTRNDRMAISKKLDKYNANQYLDLYIGLRKDVKTRIYGWFFKRRMIKCLELINVIYRKVKS